MNKILEYKNDFNKVLPTTQELIVNQLCFTKPKQKVHEILNDIMQEKYLTNWMDVKQLKSFIMLNCDNETTLNLLKMKSFTKKENKNDT